MNGQRTSWNAKFCSAFGLFFLNVVIVNFIVDFQICRPKSESSASLNYIRRCPALALVMYSNCHDRSGQHRSTTPARVSMSLSTYTLLGPRFSQQGA